MAVDAQKVEEPKSNPIPDHVPMERETKTEKEKVEFTPESVQEDASLLEKQIGRAHV